MFRRKLLKKVPSERAQIIVEIMERLSGGESEVQGGIVQIVDFTV